MSSTHRCYIPRSCFKKSQDWKSTHVICGKRWVRNTRHTLCFYKTLHRSYCTEPFFHELSSSPTWYTARYNTRWLSPYNRRSNSFFV